MNETLNSAHKHIAEYELVRKIGKGSASEVWLAITAAHELYAVKIYNNANNGREISEHEFAVASQFHHDNILSPKTVLTLDNESIIVYPYCDGRSVDAVAGFVNEPKLWQFVRDISAALAEIHSKNQVHGDVQAAHILWDGVKFLLSGFSGCHSPASLSFMSPEAHQNYTSASDVWSLGAVVFYLHMGCHVFNGLGGAAQHNDSPLPYMRKTLPELSEFVQRCLSFNPQDRPTAQNINELSSQRLDVLSHKQPVRSYRKSEANKKTARQVSFWPDEMIEI